MNGQAENNNSMPVPKMVGLSHVGLVRTSNEDYIYTSQEEGIAVLADGMGGHQAGEVASEMAVEVAVEELRYAQQFKSRDLMQCLMQVGQAMEMANTHVHNLSMKKPELAGMGTTLVLALFRGHKLFFAHVGDSRLYRFRGNELKQLTRDHSLMQEVLDHELFPSRGSAREAGVGENVLTRSLGYAVDVDVDVDLVESQPGDIYLLCSDGLYGPVGDAKLVVTLAEPDQSLADKANHLLTQALDTGAKDNVSLVLVQPG
jgi:protein phosphatase